MTKNHKARKWTKEEQLQKLKELSRGKLKFSDFPEDAKEAVISLNSDVLYLSGNFSPSGKNYYKNLGGGKVWGEIDQKDIWLKPQFSEDIFLQGFNWFMHSIGLSDCIGKNYRHFLYSQIKDFFDGNHDGILNRSAEISRVQELDFIGEVSPATRGLFDILYRHAGAGSDPVEEVRRFLAENAADINFSLKVDGRTPMTYASSREMYSAAAIIRDTASQNAGKSTSSLPPPPR